jgi:hypothetical protein
MPSYDFSIKVVFVELYKERLYDLLSTQVSTGVNFLCVCPSSA